MKSRLLGAVCVCGIAFLFVLTGCATQAQKQRSNMQAQLVQAISETNTCYSDISNEEAFKSINAVLILGHNDPRAVEKMLIGRTATQSEKEALLQVLNLSSLCREKNLTNMANIHPDFVSIYAEWYAQYDEEFLILLEGETTIGEVNKLRKKRLSKQATQWNAVTNKIDQQLGKAHQSEMAARERARAALQQWNYQQQQIQQNQQIINSMNRPKMTDCHFMGNDISCTTY